MSNINHGEAQRLKSGSQWEHTIRDLCDLMDNYKHAITVGEQQEHATRAISFVLGNLQRRGIIYDQFIDIRDDPSQTTNKKG